MPKTADQMLAERLGRNRCQTYCYKHLTGTVVAETIMLPGL